MKPIKNAKEVFCNFIKLYGEANDCQKERYVNLFNRFKSEFNKDEAYFCSSSGRVEVCGNHTDHNGGKVISLAVSLDTLACFMPREDNKVFINSEGYKPIEIDIDNVYEGKNGDSCAMIRGIIIGFIKRGYKVGGFEASVTSNVLSGAGISSSASFELLIAEILNFLYNDGKVSNEEKAKISQFSEREYFCKPCGLLDQTAISFGGLNVLDFSDTEKIGVTKIENDLSDFCFILVNTGGSHENLTDEYASIPLEMKKVANAYGYERLIEISEDDFYKKLPEFYNKLKDREITRAIHFYNENKRVDTVYNALIKNEYNEFLTAINESGISSMCFLQNCYVAGSDIQPIIKAIALLKSLNRNGATRVHGGGFAGTVLHICKNENVKDIVNELNKYYQSKDIILLKARAIGTIVL